MGSCLSNMASDLYIYVQSNAIYSTVLFYGEQNVAITIYNYSWDSCSLKNKISNDV